MLNLSSVVLTRATLLLPSPSCCGENSSDNLKTCISSSKLYVRSVNCILVAKPSPLPAAAAAAVQMLLSCSLERFKSEHRSTFIRTSCSSGAPMLLSVVRSCYCYAARFLIILHRRRRQKETCAYVFVPRGLSALYNSSTARNYLFVPLPLLNNQLCTDFCNSNGIGSILS